MKLTLFVVAALLLALSPVFFMRWFPVRVQGESMLPALRPGDVLGVRKTLREAEPRPGQIVIAQRGGLRFVKRVTEGPGELAPGAVGLEGENPAGAERRDADGPYHRGDIVGVVRFRYWPPSRIRLVR